MEENHTEEKFLKAMLICAQVAAHNKINNPTYLIKFRIEGYKMESINVFVTSAGDLPGSLIEKLSTAAINEGGICAFKRTGEFCATFS